MQIRMLRTVTPLGYATGDNKSITFFKGRKYRADIATNQPDYKTMGKVFVKKKVRRGNYKHYTIDCMLVAGDYKVAN